MPVNFACGIPRCRLRLPELYQPRLPENLNEYPNLAAGRDSVMSYAASLAGMKLDPVEAGRLFPIEIK